MSTFPLPANPDGIGGSYYGTVIVTSPMTIALQVLNFGLVNVDGALTGTLNISEMALYNGDIGLHGITDGDTFTVTSDVISNTVLGLPVQRRFTLVGHTEEGGRILKATYTAVVTNLLCDPVIEQGMFSASRPGTPGSDSLLVAAADRSLPLRGSTRITVTLLSTLMQPITETTRITLTSDLGAMTPLAVDMVDGVAVATFHAGDTGVAVATFHAGDTMGEAILFATNGEITGTTYVEVEGIYRVYLPLVGGGGESGTPDLVVQEIIATVDSVQVIVKNQGEAEVTDSFWVDVYIDPHTVPSETNQMWNDLSAEGLVWGVKTALVPGEAIVLSIDDAYYWPQISRITWPLLAGTPVYAQVDSWNPDTPYGVVREGHEIAGEPYVNNIGFTRVRRDDIGVTEIAPVSIERELPPGELPRRSEPEGLGR